MVNQLYLITQDDGILKKGMRCYCFAATETHLFLFFQYPVIGQVQEVKLPINKLFLLKSI